MKNNSYFQLSKNNALEHSTVIYEVLF